MSTVTASWVDIDEKSLSDELRLAGLPGEVQAHVKTVYRQRLEALDGGMEVTVRPEPGDRLSFWMDFSDLDDYGRSEPRYELKSTLPDGTAVPSDDIDIELPAREHAELQAFLAQWRSWAQYRRRQEADLQRLLRILRQMIIDPAQRLSALSATAFVQAVGAVESGRAMPQPAGWPVSESTDNFLARLPRRELAALSTDRLIRAARLIHSEAMGVKGPDITDPEAIRGLKGLLPAGADSARTRSLLEDLMQLKELKNRTIQWLGEDVAEALSNELELIEFGLRFQQWLGRLHEI